RLRDVVVRAGVETDDAVDLRGARGQHQDGDAALGAEPSADLEPGEPREHEVEDEGVVRLRTRSLEPRLAVRDRVDVVTLAAKRGGERVGDRLLVLDDENALRHR